MNAVSEVGRFDDGRRRDLTAPPLRLDPVPFDEAVAYTRGRGVELPSLYSGHLQGIARAESFSVAGLARLDQIEQVRDSLTQALERGETFAAWQARVRRGEIPLDLPAHRLDNIYRTNIQGAYARGRCQQHDVIADRRPWLLYSAVNDSRTRPAHAAMNGTLLHRDDPWWSTHRPPNGYRCRCTAIALTESQARQRGAPKPAGADPVTGLTADPDDGWNYDICGDPRAGTRRAIERARSTASPPVAATLDRVQTTADSLDAATWRELPNSQRGSNPGGIYEAPDGSRHYVKFYADPAQAATELAAARLYERMGVQTLRPGTVSIDGRTGVATPWVDGLRKLDPAQFTAHVDDVARVYNASVLAKNWDAVGLDFDNLVLHPNGRLVLVDSGGSFRYRAQGGSKPFGKDIAEAASLLDPSKNASAAAVFGQVFAADVFAGERVAAALSRLTADQVRADLLAAGIAAREVGRLTASVEARRVAMLERYGLQGGRLTDKARHHYDVFTTDFDRAAFSRESTRGAHSTDRSKTMRDDMVAGPVPAFERYLAAQFGSTAPKFLRSIFKSWSSSSSRGGGAVVKLWASARMGADITWHSGDLSGDAAKFLAANHISLERAFDLLDAEHAFTTYSLRRLHGYDPFAVQRGMSYSEVERAYASGEFRLNAAASATTSNRVFSTADKRIQFEARADDFVKTWYQGSEYLSFQDKEFEYAAIGRTYPAKIKAARRQ